MGKKSWRRIISSFIGIASAAAGLGTATALELRVTQCSSCTTIQGLKTHAQSFATSVARNEAVGPKFNVLVTSQVVPLSAMYGAQIVFIGGVNPENTSVQLTSITTTAEAADDLDGIVFARKIEPVEIPANVGGSARTAVYEDVNSYLRQVLPVSLSLGGAYVVRDTRSGGSTPIPASGIRVNVRFPDGSTAQVIILPSTAMSSIAWVLVPGSERDPSGEPYTGSAIGGPQGPTLQIAFNRANVRYGRAMTACTVTTTVCTNQCYTRRFYMSCR